MTNSRAPLFALIAALIAFAGCRGCSDRNHEGSRAPASAPDADERPEAAPATADHQPWIATLGGEGEDHGLCVAVAPDGSVVAGGEFNGELPVSPEDTAAPLRSRGGSDAFVAFWSPEGELRWAVAVGGPGEDKAMGVALDGDGEVIATGRFQATARLGGGAAAEGASMVSPGSSSAFVIRFDARGEVRWSRVIGGTGWAEGQAIAAEDEGAVVVGGRFAGEIDVDPGEPRAQRTADGDVDAFALRLGSDGSLVWARTFGGSRVDEVRAVAATPEGPVLAGHFSEEVDLDPGGGESLHRSRGFTDVFVMSLDAGGELRWVRTFGGPLLDQAYGVATGPRGQVVVTGIFVGEAISGSDPVSALTVSSSGRSDVFLLKLNSQGDAEWLRSVGGPSSDYGSGVTVTSSGDLVAVGRFGDEVDFDPGDGERRLAVTGDEGRPDGFVLVLDDEGSHRWSERLGGPGRDHGRGVAASPAGGAWATGSFEAGATFPGDLRGTAAGSSDAFVVGLSWGGEGD